jgi:hypothetical protein
MKHCRWSLAFLPLVALHAAWGTACGTDNGDTVFGPTFEAGGSSGASSSGTSGASSGSPGDPDGSANQDGGGDDGATTDSSTSSCAAGTVAVLAGNDTSLSGAIQSKGGAWSGAAIAGGAALSKPALVAFGQGFLGATHGSGNVLQSTQYTTAWSAATTFGNTGVKGPPTLAVAGTKAHVVYSAGPAAKRDFAHGIHDGNAWNTADAIVGTAQNDFSFGTLGAGLMGAGAEVVFMENGTDYKLYTRQYTTAWSAPTVVSNAPSIGADVPAFPVITSAEGKYDLVAVYVAQTTRRLSYAGRDATGKAWVNGGVVHDFATTNEPFSFARVGTSIFLVVFRGQDGNGYYARGTVDAAGTFTWVAAQPIGGAGNVAVDSAPAIARGVCGDDAIVVYASAGQVKATRLRGTTWTASETVTGASGSRVAVATK